MRRNEPRVLVAGDNYYASLAAVRGLRRGGYEPWFACYELPAFAARSRATAGVFRLPHPNLGDRPYVEALAHAAYLCDAQVVLPCNELALKAVASNLDAFPGGLVVGSTSRDTVDRTTDKALLAHVATQAGLASPPTFAADADTIDGRITFPAIVKSARSAVGEDEHTWLAPPSAIVHDLDELRAQLAERPPSIVQPFLEADLIAVSGVAWEGEIVCSVHQQAKRIHPRPLGMSAFAETVPADPDVDRALAPIMRALGWSGIFELQLLRTADGAHPIDLNPRPYGSMALAIRAGLNLPAIWVDLLLGREPRIGTPRVGVRFRAESRELKSLAAALRSHRPGEALRIVQPHRRTTHAVWSWRDPAPSLVALKLMRNGRRARRATASSAGQPASSPRTTPASKAFG